jgi:hypothetical protein
MIPAPLRRICDITPRRWVYFFLVRHHRVIPLLVLVYGFLRDMHRHEKVYSLLSVLLVQEFALPYPEKIDYCLRRKLATPWRALPLALRSSSPFAAENTPVDGNLNSCYSRRYEPRSAIEQR